MVKLAFSGLARYPDYSDGYRYYLAHTRSDNKLSEKDYRRVIREYCKILADRIVETGAVDLPGKLGLIAAASMRRKPQYRGDRFIGYGKMDWDKGHYDGSFYAFGVVYLPNRKASNNLRCLGFVANRQLYKKLKARSGSWECNWKPIEFNEEMI